MIELTLNEVSIFINILQLESIKPVHAHSGAAGKSEVRMASGTTYIVKQNPEDIASSARSELRKLHGQV